ncbi:hypothetical protein BDF20DRAFT_828279 [Mycotypha africana]|uniref:uncharacterized protein n=1 Tax=Mycotypha africana TaxID=64632 RepID=UPI002301521B|nr:uncharacterized protein BDF20DRAFT_828279 [Mycotypha africana]KAI8968182.1 hypothetical protein BDF20DRAFT_828279 [Mycotypha africana]
MTLPVWTTTDVHDLNAPVPQATACRGPGQIALTYGEGPTDVTAKVLNALKATQAKANFFVNTSWLTTQQYAMILQRAYNDGHLIGMTYRPPKDTSEGLTDEEIQIDVLNSAQAIEDVIGVAPKYIRLHYVQPEDIRLEHILYDLGYTIIGYNLDVMDYNNTKNNPNAITNYYKETFAKQMDTYDTKSSYISIQSDIPETGSSEAVNDVIKAIDDAGYTMVRLDGCLIDNYPYKEHAGSLKFVNDKHSWGQPMYKSGQQVIRESTNTTFGVSSVSRNDTEANKANIAKKVMTSDSDAPQINLYTAGGMILLQGLIHLL